MFMLIYIYTYCIFNVIQLSNKFASTVKKNNLKMTFFSSFFCGYDIENPVKNAIPIIHFIYSVRLFYQVKMNIRSEFNVNL